MLLLSPIYSSGFQLVFFKGVYAHVVEALIKTVIIDNSIEIFFLNALSFPFSS